VVKLLTVEKKRSAIPMPSLLVKEDRKEKGPGLEKKRENIEGRATRQGSGGES